MTGKTRRHFSADFKAKVAIEALKEQQTISVLSAKYEAHPHQITEWEKHLIAQSAGVFETGKAAV